MEPFTPAEEYRPSTDAVSYKCGDDPLSIIMKQMQNLNEELTTLKSTINQNWIIITNLIYFY